MTERSQGEGASPVKSALLPEAINSVSAPTPYTREELDALEGAMTPNSPWRRLLATAMQGVDTEKLIDTMRREALSLGDYANEVSSEMTRRVLVGAATRLDSATAAYRAAAVERGVRETACAQCGKPLNDGEAKTFTVCDECWVREHPSSDEELEAFEAHLADTQFVTSRDQQLVSRWFEAAKRLSAKRSGRRDTEKE